MGVGVKHGPMEPRKRVLKAEVWVSVWKHDPMDVFATKDEALAWYRPHRLAQNEGELMKVRDVSDETPEPREPYRDKSPAVACPRGRGTLLILHTVIDGPNNLIKTDAQLFECASTSELGICGYKFWRSVGTL